MRIIMQHNIFQHEHWLALAFDMDGCVFSDDYLDARIELLSRRNTPPDIEEEKELLLRFNKTMLDTIIASAKGNYTRLYVLSGTKRQDFATDQLNSKSNISISAFHAPGILIEYMKEQLPDQHIEFIPFYMADIIAGNAASRDNIGMTFKAALRALDGEQDVEHAIWAGMEHKKWTLTYSHAHLLAAMAEIELQMIPHTIHYRLIDDDQFILQGLTDFTQTCSHHFPASVRMEFLEHSTNVPLTIMDAAQVINGTGIANGEFMSVINSLHTIHGEDSYSGADNFYFRQLNFKSVEHADALLKNPQYKNKSFCSIL